jgi:subtilisin family serine protease
MKTIALFLFGMLFYSSLCSQNIDLKVKLNHSDNGYAILTNNLKSNILNNYNIRSIEIVSSYPNSQNPELLKFFTVKANGKQQDIVDYLNSLGIIEIIEPEEYFYPAICTNPVPPVNDLYIAQNWVNNYAMEMINANCAWSITKGNPNIIVGIADTEFELSHEDLSNQIISIQGQSSNDHPHGTNVAGMVAPETNNNKGISGIGYNSKIAAHRIPHELPSGRASTSDIRNAIWTLYQTGVPIINVSWTGTGLDRLAAEEITQNGTTLVLGAGNTPTSTSHSAIANIPGVILVSSVNHENNHGPTNHAHNVWVDICAPGTNVSTTHINNSYRGVWGTSFAAPIVAGTIALMIAINPCLTPAQIENLVKVSADPINDAHLFPDMLGAGRINAYRAVMQAGTRSFKNQVLSGNQILSAGYGFEIENTTIAHNSDITLQARMEININKDFEIPQGSSFTILIDPDAVNNCN